MLVIASSENPRASVSQCHADNLRALAESGAARCGFSTSETNANFRAPVWSSEAAFFDKVAEIDAADLALDPDISQRYQSPMRRTYAKEFLFALFGRL